MIEGFKAIKGTGDGPFKSGAGYPLHSKMDTKVCGIATSDSSAKKSDFVN